MKIKITFKSVLIAIIIIEIIGVLIFLSYNTFSLISNTKKLNILSLTLNNLKSEIEIKKELEDEIVKTSSKIEELKGFILTEKNLFIFLENLKTSAENAGLTFEGFVFDDIQNALEEGVNLPKDFKKGIFTLNFQGTYYNFKSFLLYLEKYKGIVTIEHPIKLPFFGPRSLTKAFSIKINYYMVTKNTPAWLIEKQ